MRRQKNLKLKQETIDELVKLSNELDLTQSQVIERAIQDLAEICGADSPKAAPEKENQSAFEKTLELLRDQLALKDAQIAAANAQLTSTTEALKAAQTLHAIDRKEDVLALGPEQKKSRWTRLREAWRGC